MAAPETILDEMTRQEQAFKLKIGGLTFQQIADSPHPTDRGRKLYASPSAARDAWRTAAARHAGVKETAEIREEWRLRNEAIIRTLMPTCLNREHKDHHWAIDRYTRLFAEHARMLGLYQDKLHVTQGTTDLRTALAELEASVATGVEPELQELPQGAHTPA
jgi:hypothetical protein